MDIIGSWGKYVEFQEQKFLEELDMLIYEHEAKETDIMKNAAEETEID